jgi:predicted ester cyclase
MEIEVTATATIETGGGFSDEPAWAMVDNIVIDGVTHNGDRVNTQSYIDAATEEFCE